MPATRFGVDTTFREQSGVLDDNGYSTTFYGGLNGISAFFSVATTINTINGVANPTPNDGPALQTAFELNASGLTPPGGPNGSTQESTGYWIIGSADGTQGASISPGGPNVQSSDVRQHFDQSLWPTLDLQSERQQFLLRGARTGD